MDCLNNFLINHGAVILASASTLIATLSAVWLTNRNNIKKLKIEFELNKAEKKLYYLQERQEELFIKSKLFLNGLVSYYFPYYHVMKGEMEPNTALEIGIKNKNADDYNRVDMLIKMYFPEVNNPFSEILKIRDLLNRIISEVKKDYDRGGYIECLQKNSFYELHQKMIKLSDEFEQHVLNINIKN